MCAFVCMYVYLYRLHSLRSVILCVDSKIYLIFGNIFIGKCFCISYSVSRMYITILITFDYRDILYFK